LPAAYSEAMTMNNGEIIKKAGKFVKAQLHNTNHPELVFHNLAHTEYMVRTAQMIAGLTQLSNQDMTILIASVWFRDIGFTDQTEGPLASGSRIACSFFEKQGMPQTVIDRITGLILFDPRHHVPGNLLEQIIADTETVYFGKRSFLKKNELLRKETELTTKRTIEKEAWFKQTISDLEHHRYHTPSARTFWTDQKSENLVQMKLRAAQQDQAIRADQSNTMLKRAEMAEKSIETAFAIASQNNQHLSSLADNKAHILITVNSIILSALISLLVRRLQENDYLTFPTFLLLSINLLTMVLAIIATRPTVSKGVFSKADLEQKKTNLLFFGNYFKMLPEQFTSGMWVMVDDKVYIYNSLMLDIYQQGTIIGRKYHFLRLAYNIFMCGLVISILAFFAAAIIYNHYRVPPLPK